MRALAQNRSSPGLTQSLLADSDRAAVRRWELDSWVTCFDPNEQNSIRSGRWWDAGVSGRGTGWVRLGTDGHPYGGRGALQWSIEAAGGYDIDVP